MLINHKPTIKNFGSFSIQFENSLSNEKPGFYGISHLVEHCMFEKVKEFEQELLKYDIGYNAITNKYNVIFFITGIDKYVKKFKNKFFKAIVEYEITEDVFERERNIIIQEYIQSYSNQTSEFKNNFIKHYFNSYLTLGDLEDIKNITYENFIKFKNEFYSIPDYIINVSKFEFKYNKEDEKYLNKEINQKFPNFCDFKADGYKEKKYLSFSSFEDNRCILMFSIFKSDYDETKFEQFLYYTILANYLANGLSSPLYKNIREELQCVYSIMCDVDEVKNNEFIFNVLIKTTNENVNLVKNKLQDVINNLKVNKKRFNDVVKAIKISFESIKYRDEMKWEKIKYYKLFLKEFQEQKLTFEKFKMYTNKFINEDLKYYITDLELKEKMK